MKIFNYLKCKWTKKELELIHLLKIRRKKFVYLLFLFPQCVALIDLMKHIHKYGEHCWQVTTVKRQKRFFLHSVCTNNPMEMSMYFFSAQYTKSYTSYMRHNVSKNFFLANRMFIWRWSVCVCGSLVACVRTMFLMLCM